MKRDEWRDHHGLTEEEMAYLEYILKSWDGKIVKIVENPTREILRP